MKSFTLALGRNLKFCTVPTRTHQIFLAPKSLTRIQTERKILILFILSCDFLNSYSVMVINVGLNEDGLFWLPAVFGFQFTNLAVCSGKLIVECIRWELQCDRADVYG